jgi:nucleoside-diphosphate-sugar epimerase
MASAHEPLSVAVTGPTGTFGFGLIPLLEAEPRVKRIIGIARRPFDPAEHRWTKMEYRQGDVRSQDALRDAFAGADVVVHLAFLISGNAPADTIRQINVDGTLNAFRAAREAGAERFVYSSSVAAYGFHRDNPVGITEQWPVRGSERLFYPREKAELELALERESKEAEKPALYLLRPPIVLGPHAVGAKAALPGLATGRAKRAFDALKRVPLRLPIPAPNIPFQFIHEDDVGQALLKCILGDGPPGAYNIAADDVLTGADLVRELGLAPIPVPGRFVHTAARVAAAIPKRGLPPGVDWVEALTYPAIMDTTKARQELGWRPRHTALEALRATLGR